MWRVIIIGKREEKEAVTAFFQRVTEVAAGKLKLPPNLPAAVTDTVVI